MVPMLESVKEQERYLGRVSRFFHHRFQSPELASLGFHFRPVPKSDGDRAAVFFGSNKSV